jgi:sugar phosphate isomerase/epimerase
MKFGYMAGFRADLLTEINFAKKHFDFIEITLLPEILKTIDGLFSDLKNATADIEILGHIHWEIIETAEIIKNIEILKGLGAKKITIHPFQDLSIKENVKIFNEINNFTKENQLQLLIENVSKAPYNSADNLLKIIENIPGAKITLDIGHANRINEVDKFLKQFQNQIGHVHLHDNLGDLDHIFYDDHAKLKAILAKISSFGYDNTVLMETFSIMKDNQNTSQEFPELQGLHIKQLELIKKL